MIDETLRAQIEAECLKIGCCTHCSKRFTEDKLLEHYKDPDNGIAESEEPSQKKSKLDACVLCLGVLSSTALDDLSSRAVACLSEKPYDDPVFTTTLSLPVSTLLRDKSVYLHLKRTVAGFGDSVRFTRLLPLKDIWKQLINGRISAGVGKTADNGYFAELMVNVEMSYRGDRRETEVIRKLRPQLRSEVTRVLTDSTLESTPEEKLLRCLTVPPVAAAAAPAYQLTCCRGAVFVAGRYNKYSRELSQTPWTVTGGGRRTDSSLQEMITNTLVAYTGASGVRFSASGREDVDVRTLGRGRPFVSELCDPHVTVQLTPAVLRRLQRRINASRPLVRVRDLQLVSREQTGSLKQGEEDRSKTYTALVQSLDGPVRGLERLGTLKELEVSQETPVRVLHRRPMATRQKTVMWMQPERCSETVFKLRLQTQAGTYIKEFVHGDMGRTVPNLGTLLDGKFDILALDVESIDLDWPAEIPDDDDDVAAGESDGGVDETLAAGDGLVPVSAALPVPQR